MGVMVVVSKGIHCAEIRGKEEHKRAYNAENSKLKFVCNIATRQQAHHLIQPAEKMQPTPRTIIWA